MRTQYLSQECLGALSMYKFYNKCSTVPNMSADGKKDIRKKMKIRRPK